MTIKVEIRVADKEMWSELQKRGKVIGKGCFFGGMTVTEAVEKGSFPRSGKWSKEKEISNSETLSWVDRVCEGSKETSRRL